MHHSYNEGWQNTEAVVNEGYLQMWQHLNWVMLDEELVDSWCVHILSINLLSTKKCMDFLFLGPGNGH